MLSGYIAYSIADRPGLAPGLIGGLLASQLQAGFSNKVPNSGIIKIGLSASKLVGSLSFFAIKSAI
jgi:fructose-specific phosphotransferase system IIC component